MSKENKRTSYLKAVQWLHNNFIACNEINRFELDYRFDLFDDESNTYIDVFQYYLTDCDDRDVSFLENSFSDMNFAYCHELGLYVLCVTHYGTSWDYVPVEVLNDDIIDSIYDDIPDCI